MKSKKLIVPSDCEGALQTAIRIRVVYLQGFREQIRAKWLRKKTKPEVVASLQRGEQAIMTDIANLTLLADNLMEQEAS
jgi:hypothetical protein